MSNPERDKAIRAVLYALRHPLMMMSIEDRGHARELAAKYEITALDLITAAHHRAMHEES